MLVGAFVGSLQEYDDAHDRIDEYVVMLQDVWKDVVVDIQVNHGSIKWNYMPFSSYSNTTMVVAWNFMNRFASGWEAAKDGV